MCGRYLNNLILFVFLITSAAQAAELRVFRDRGGMPRCLEIKPSVSILLKWDAGEKYEREIVAIGLTRHLVTFFSRGGRHDQPDPHDPFLPCKDWKRWTRSIPESYGSRIEAGASQINGIPLPAYVQRGLAQIRLGADEYRSEESVAAFLERNPIADFTLDLNRELTGRFGVGFTSEIYRAWIDAHPANAKFRRDVLERLAQVERMRDGMFTEAFRNRVLVRVSGMGYEGKSSQRFEVFTDQLKRLGVPAVRIEKVSLATQAENSVVVRDYLDRLLSTGKNVFIITQSKGGTEAIEALAMLKAKLESPPPGYGKVEAYIGMSGVYGPSFLAEWARHLPQSIFFSPMLKKALREDGVPNVTHLDAFDDLADEPMAEFAERISKTGLPSGTVYLNVVGAIEGNGLAKDKTVQQVQNDLIRGQLKKFGSNDGYIEFPGTILPAAWAPRQLTIAINGSHALVDGTFAGRRLDDRHPDEDREVGYALFDALLAEVDR